MVTSHAKRGRARRDELPSLSPWADYHDGEITLSEAACRYVELCNGIAVQDVVDHFGDDESESKAIRGRLRSEGAGCSRLFYRAAPNRHLRRISGDNTRHGATTLDMSEPAPDAELLTVEEVATVLRCCETTIRRRISEGSLPAAKVGGRFLVARAALASIVAAAGGEPGMVCASAFNMAVGGRR